MVCVKVHDARCIDIAARVDANREKKDACSHYAIWLLTIWPELLIFYFFI